MSDDRTLLEQAAKAAGVELHHWSVDGRFVRVSPYVDDDGGFWEPLTDDGDAFRLQIALGMTVMIIVESHEVIAFFYGGVRAQEPIKSRHDTAAVRRAIVKCAAAASPTIEQARAAASLSKGGADDK